MEKGVTVLVIILFILVIAAFIGNIEIIAALIAQDTSPITENGVLVFVAVIADIILLYLLIKKLSKPTANSLSLAKRGITNRLNIKKQSAEIKKTSRNITDSINRLKELRALGIERASTIRTHKFCQLLVSTSNEEHLKACLEAINKRNSIVTEINDIEQNILQLADRYRVIGNAEKCVHYLEIVESGQNKSNFDEIKKVCNEQLSLREKEGKAIRLWTTFVVVALSIIMCICVVSYVKDTPYRELMLMIDNQSLTSEMCDWDNRKDEGSYYEYLHSEKGYEFLASELTKLHRNDDIEKAMWLLCIQPDCIDGIDLCASQSFINWIVDYAKSNGIRSSNQEDADDYWYLVTYTLGDYEVILTGFDDKDSDISEFSIRYYGNSSDICRRNPYHEGNVPTIQ